MKSFRGQLAEWGAVTVAKYRKGKFTITCKTFDGQYFMEFHNGRQSSTTRYTSDKDEANEWVKSQIKDGYRKE